ncbi:hypothetical protein PPACK8108_LOCUS752 [Phakopsora pachyrhizi]|uniref:ferric-chelate reductase (NADPH) n=1 Tax=Phakopsora pachyrhizi TaxID=170000 RepID=A0AAV0AG18_PHAPC|nr:hypothetical protein PPACK8108_LOCUS752 [Phakopsora pachyrhizi]
MIRLPKFVQERILYSRSSKTQGFFLLNDSRGKIRNEKERSSPSNSSNKRPNKLYLLSRPIFQAFNLKVPLTGGLNFGQTLIIIVYMVALVILSLYNNTDDATNIVNYRRFGFIALAQLPILVTLSMKNGPLNYFIGQGYEKLNFLHRFIGRMVFVFSLVHGALQIRFQVTIRKSFRLHEASLYGFIALCALFMMAFTGLRFFRSATYQLFLMTHIIGYIVVIVTLWMHTPATQPYIAYIIAATGFDYLMKIVKARVKNATFTAMPGGLTRIEVHGINDGWRAGQHVFIRVMKGRHIFEKHPFTIANAPNSSSPHGGTGHMLLVAKAAGDFTKSIHELAGAPQTSDSLVDVSGKEKGQSSPDLESDNKLSGFKKISSNTTYTVIVDGPYGSFFTDMTQYRNVLLCAGGSGFTFCMSTLEDIVGEAVQGGRKVTRNITIVWSLREPDMIESFGPALENTIAVGQAHDINITLKLFITAQSGINFSQNILPTTLVEFNSTRPDLSQIVDEMINNRSSDKLDGCSGGGLGIGVCGPVQMVDNMGDVVRRLDKDCFDQVGGVTLLS